MSIQRKYLATAFIVHLAFMTPTNCFAGRKNLHDPEVTPCSPAGIPLHTSQRDTDLDCSSEYSEQDKSHWTTWDYFEENSYKFPKISKEENHIYKTLPPDFIARWMKTSTATAISTTEARLRNKRRDKESADRRAHANAVAEEFIENQVKDRQSFLDIPIDPDGYEMDVHQYIQNNWEIICNEYPLLPPMESEDWKSPTHEEMRSWRWESHEAEMTNAAIRHYYNFGLFDLDNERSALHYYPLPEEIKDWKLILKLNPGMPEAINDYESEAPDPDKAMRIFNHIYTQGEDNYRFFEDVPINFDWEAYWNIVIGLEQRNHEHNNTDAPEDDPFHLKEVGEFPAEQDLHQGKKRRESSYDKVQSKDWKYKNVRGGLLNVVIQIQQHYIKYASGLGLLYPFLPASFKPLNYLHTEEVRARFKQTVSRWNTWTDRKKAAWATADYFLGLLDAVRDKEVAPKGFTLPKDWSAENQWELLSKMEDEHGLVDDPFAEVKTVAHTQAAMHDAWDKAGEDGPVAADFTQIVPGVPEWYDTQNHLDSNQNPELREDIEEAIKVEYGESTWEAASPGVKRMLVEEKAQTNFMKGECRRTVAPKGFDAKQYYMLNRRHFKKDEAFRNIRGIPTVKDVIALERHFVDKGMPAGHPYTKLESLPPLPQWADEEYYFAQTNSLKQMAQGLNSEAKRLLMLQHFFTEGYDQDLTLAARPSAGALNEYDSADYEAKARKIDRELSQMLDFLKGKSQNAQNALLLIHYGLGGSRTGIHSSNGPHIYHASDIHPKNFGAVGTPQDDGSVKVESGSADGLVAELKAVDLHAGSYKIILDISSPAKDTETIAELEMQNEYTALPSQKEERFSIIGIIETTGDAPLQIRLHSRNAKEFVIHKIIIRPMIEEDTIYSEEI